MAQGADRRSGKKHCVRLGITLNFQPLTQTRHGNTFKTDNTLDNRDLRQWGGNYITQARPTNFHQFFTRKVLTGSETINDFREVTEAQRTQLENSDKAWVEPSAELVARWRAAWQRKVFGWKKQCEFSYGGYDPATGFFWANDRRDINATMAEQILRHATAMPLVEGKAAFYNVCDGSKELPPIRVSACNVSASALGIGLLGDCTDMFNQCGMYVGGAQRDTTMDGVWTVRFVGEGCGELGSIKLTDVTNMFYCCTAIKEVATPIDMANIASAANMFAYTSNMTDVKLKNLKCSLKIGIAASYETMRYLVDNAANTTAITVTVGNDVYAKLNGDTSNAAAAALTPEELAQWTQLKADATEKNIAFATS